MTLIAMAILAALTPAHHARVKARIERFYPVVGDKPVGAITAADLLPVLQAIERAGMGETAARARTDAGQVLRYAVATGRATHDPTAALRGALAPADLLDPRPALERWLRVQARVWIEARVAEFAPEVGVEPAGVIVGERRTRWGSCSPRGVLSFCYRLIMAPPPAIDAIVLHELCHLVHLDHSPRFHAVLERHCPDHRRHRAWLRAHESELRL